MCLKHLLISYTVHLCTLIIQPYCVNTNTYKRDRESKRGKSKEEEERKGRRRMKAIKFHLYALWASVMENGMK